MYEDDPQDLVFDVLGGAVFGEHPLGRPVIGTRESVAAGAAPALQRLPRRPLRAARRRRRGGGLDHHGALVKLVESAQARGGLRRAPAPEQSAVRPPAERCASSAGHRAVPPALGAPRPRARRRAPLRAARARHDPRRHVLVAPFPGGPREARPGLQRLRSPSQYARTGQVGVYVGTRPDNVGKALRVVGDELERLRRRRRKRGRARAGQGSRQGPHRARAGVDFGAHVPARLGAAGRTSAADARRDDRARRRGQRDDVAALARELLAPERLQRGGDRRRRGRLPRGSRAASPALAVTA